MNQELQRRDVQTGISDLTRVEVTKGVGDDTQIALSATNSKNLRDHLQVKLNQWDENHEFHSTDIVVIALVYCDMQRSEHTWRRITGQWKS